MQIIALIILRSALLSYKEISVTAFVFCIAAILSSCAPLPVLYVVDTANILAVDSMYLNNKNQLLMVVLTQRHFPNKKVENDLRISVKNLSADYLKVTGSSLIQIRSLTNLIDNTQSQALLETGARAIAAGGTFTFRESYWSGTFTGGIRQFLEVLRREKVFVVVSYLAERGVSVENEIILRPDFKSFRNNY